jgi:DNA-binding transcriptional ArsR family regulator
MKKVVHIIPIGHTKITLTQSMRQFPFHKTILVLGKKLGPGERKARSIAEEIKTDLGSIAEVDYLNVDIDDVYSAAIEIAIAIRVEQKRGNQVKVNASGSLRTIGISCYLASAITGASLYVALPKYEKGRVTGISGVVEIPSFPIREVGAEELTILKNLGKKGPTQSVDELIQRLNSKDKTAPGYQKERARMSYHIKKLRESGFLETKKQGKNLMISLAKLGELYSIGRG